jgi:surfeit locus 1 family protein
VYRFALRPKWIVSHVFVIAVVVLFANLGLWQLRRLDERRAFNDLVRSELATAPQTISPEMIPAEWQRVVLRGTFVADTEVLVANRAQHGQPGYWLLGAFETANGVVAVNRGFLARATVAQGDLSELPVGEVELVGLVQQSRSGVFATSVGTSGVIEISQVDLARLGERWSEPLAPFWVHAASAQGASLEPVVDPVLDDGPHLSYAGQWFIFALIGVGGYLLVLRRRSREGTQP